MYLYAIDASLLGPYAWIFAGAGMLFGIVASMWSKLKGFAWRLVSLFIQRIEIPTESAHEAVVSYLIKHYKRSRSYDRMYGANWDYQRDGRYGLIPYELFGSRMLIFWNGWFPFMFSNQLENKHSTSKPGGSSDTPSGVSKVYSSITFLRGTLDVEKIVREACMARNNLSWSVEDDQEAKKNRFSIHLSHNGATATTTTAAAAMACRGISKVRTGCSRTPWSNSVKPARTTAKRSIT